MFQKTIEMHFQWDDVFLSSAFVNNNDTFFFFHLSMSFLQCKEIKKCIFLKAKDIVWGLLSILHEENMFVFDIFSFDGCWCNLKRLFFCLKNPLVSFSTFEDKQKDICLLDDNDWSLEKERKGVSSMTRCPLTRIFLIPGVFFYWKLLTASFSSSSSSFLSSMTRSANEVKYHQHLSFTLGLVLPDLLFIVSDSIFF